MASSEPGRIEALVERLREEDPHATAILTDIDGTIAPITSRPEETAVPDRARSALERLAGRFALVACVSGRRATQARSLVGVDGVTYSGNHGMETLDADSNEVQVDLTLRGHQDAAACFIDHLDGELLERVDLRREDKGPIQSLHWRGVENEADAQGAVIEIAKLAEKAGLEPHWGRKVLEIRPPGCGGKGAAINSLLCGRKLTAAVYAGDDRTDLDAFRALREVAAEPGSLESCICVGIDSPEGPENLGDQADHLLADPEEWIGTLERLGT